MKLNINLSSQPYEDARQFYLQWLPLLIGLGALALALSGMAFLSGKETRSVGKQLGEEEHKIAQLDQERKQAVATLAKPENAGTRDQAQFLNALFARKAFSWTEVLTDLEQIMPTGLQVVSIKPELTNDGQLQFTLAVSTERRESAIELVRRMEMTKTFQQAQIKSENQRGENERRMRLEITSLYIPQVTQPAAQKGKR